MIAYANFNRWPTETNRKIRLIKLIREIKPQSTSRKIDYEKPIDRNHFCDDSDTEHGR